MANTQDDNQYDELSDYNLYASDVALRQAVERSGAAWAEEDLLAFGQLAGSARNFERAEQANRHAPQLRTLDGRGRRIDAVEFHPSWHELLAQYRQTGFLSLPFSDSRPGRWVAAAAGFYLHGQAEAGSLCPVAMTFAAIPVVQKEAWLWSEIGPKLYATEHDPRDVPLAQKTAAWLGMGMTEKQGGSDVRSNLTHASAIGTKGRGAEYQLSGHKWFFSAPMSDAHLVVARTDAGHSCFYVPRFLPDGRRNSVLIHRLKEKVGNRSNSSSEVEFHGAWGRMIGDEGRGIPTIIEMAAHTRLSCIVGSAALIRQCAAQALAYAQRRRAFGRTLIEQPLMRSVLADLVLESEAACVLMTRVAEAFEADDGSSARAWKRMMTPAAKFWVCKRAVELTGEAMEVFGGNGYVETGPMGRLFREAPVNSIWEGSGNVMCLDLMRAVIREPDVFAALLDELERDGAAHPRIRAELEALRDMLTWAPDELESMGRRFAQRLVLVAQACLLRKHAPSFVADGFVATRFDAAWGRVVGAVDVRLLDVPALFARAMPV